MPAALTAGPVLSELLEALTRDYLRRGEAGDMSALEREFVKAAPAYGDRKGISYAAWREAGVSAAVLRRAGIQRAQGVH